MLETVAQGGAVGPVLVALCASVWFVLSLRLFELRGLYLRLRAHPSALPRREVFARTERLGALLHALAASATLLGLLGTVSGMVETFDAMQISTFHTGSERSMAGGISTALVSTQLGLMVGIPGMIGAVLLDRLALRCRTLTLDSSLAPSRGEGPEERRR